MTSSPLDTRKLLRESTPVVAILLFWLVLTEFTHSIVSTGFLRAGVVMAMQKTSSEFCAGDSKSRR
ncbi:hypothetical protein [Haladaptatus sp. NG-WS-4]